MPAALALIVRDVAIETPRTRLVHLALAGQRFDFQAGQHIYIGLDGQPLRKPYSIACSPEQAAAGGAIELLVQVASDGSAGAHLGVPTPGVRVAIEGPKGDFVFPEQPPAHEFLFVAGGTGIAPVRALLHHAMARFPRAAVSLVYSARAAEEFAYGSEMRALSDAGRLALRQTVTRDVADAWEGERGRISAALLARVVTTTDTVCFVCGPPAMVQDVVAWLPAIGIPRDRIFAEGW